MFLLCEICQDIFFGLRQIAVCSHTRHQGCLKRLLSVLFSWLQLPAQCEDQLVHGISINQAPCSKIKPKQTPCLILASAIFGFLDTSSLLRCGQGDICIRVGPHLLPHLCPWPPPNVEETSPGASWSHSHLYIELFSRDAINQDPF